MAGGPSASGGEKAAGRRTAVSEVAARSAGRTALLVVGSRGLLGGAGPLTVEETPPCRGSGDVELAVFLGSGRERRMSSKSSVLVPEACCRRLFSLRLPVGLGWRFVTGRRRKPPVPPAAPGRQPPSTTAPQPAPPSRDPKFSSNAAKEKRAEKFLLPLSFFSSPL